MADQTDVTVGVNLTSQPTPGAQTSEMKVLVAASALTALAGAFHKQLDMGTATKLVDGLAALYVVARSGVKMAHALAAAVMAWMATQKQQPQARTVIIGAPPAPAPAAPPL